MNFSSNWRGGDKGIFPRINLDGCEIETVSSFKYIGVTLDLKLNFKKHLDSCIKKTNGKLYMFRKIRDHMSDKTALILYKAMVLPYLEYGNVFFSLIAMRENYPEYRKCKIKHLGLS